MLAYRIEINGDSSGQISWNITFASEKGKFNSTETEHIYSTVENLAEALNAISRVMN